MGTGLKSVWHQWGSCNNESDALVLVRDLMNNLFSSCNERKKSSNVKGNVCKGNNVADSGQGSPWVCTRFLICLLILLYKSLQRKYLFIWNNKASFIFTGHLRLLGSGNFRSTPRRNSSQATNVWPVSTIFRGLHWPWNKHKAGPNPTFLPHAELPLRALGILRAKRTQDWAHNTFVILHGIMLLADTRWLSKLKFGSQLQNGMFTENSSFLLARKITTGSSPRCCQVRGFSCRIGLY